MRIKVGQKIIDILRGKNNKKVLVSRMSVPIEETDKKEPIVTYKSADEILSKNKIIKLHLGCGTQYKEGWINIDNNSDNNIQKLDLNWDLRNPLPFPDNTVDFIFHEHLLEHLTVDEGQNFIKDSMRVLKQGGVLRISMPDLEVSVKNYLNLNWKQDDGELLKKYGMDYIKTRAERLNMAFHFWGHKWLYDWEELERRLKEAGCTKIKRCEFEKSDYPQLCNLETRGKSSSLVAEVIKCI